MAQATAASEGVRLHFVTDGAGDPPFVFVHGWCCDHTFFQPQFDHFKSRHRVLAMDLRGCGQSERTSEGHDITTLADDVARLCREVGITRSVIVGHSLGGMVAVELAARHPSVAGAVVAVDPGPLAMQPAARAIFEAFIAGLRGPDSDAVRRTYIERMFLATDDPERKGWIIDTMCAAPLEVAIPELQGVIDWNGPGALQLCTAPLLVLLSDPNVDGSNDPGRLLELKPDITFGVTVGAGHFHQFEVPDQINAMIERFVQAQLSA